MSAKTSASSEENNFAASIVQSLSTSKGAASLCACIAGALFVRYAWNRKQGKEITTTTKTGGTGYDSLIPFTAKQSEKTKGGPNDPDFVYVAYERIPKQAQLRRASDFFTFMNMRRSFRHFSDEAVDLDVIRNCIKVANTAPSGAHCSPWTYVVVGDAKKRMEIRKAVEAEEQMNYDRRMKQSWVDDVAPLIGHLHAVDSVNKPYLTEAAYLVVVMKEMHRLDEHGKKLDNYYPNQSTGISVGMFISALWNANLVTLPSTPMGAEAAIRKICRRPINEKVFLLMPVGYPSKDATVPYRSSKQWRKDMTKTMVVV